MEDVLDATSDLTVDYVKSYLQGIQYPLDWDDIMKLARLNRSPDNVIEVINNLQNGVYHSESELDFYLDRTIRAM